MLATVCQVYCQRVPEVHFCIPFRQSLLNIIERLPELADKIGVIIGLFCDRVMTYAAIDHFLKEAQLSDYGNTNLCFKDKSLGGYPGDIHIIVEGKSTALPKETRTRIKDIYTPARCRLCFDKLNIFSDISVGDPWGIDGVDRQRGESVAVIRTSRGEKLFGQAVEKEYVWVREIPYSEVVDGQGIDLKRGQWLGFVNAWKELGRPLPNFCETVSTHAGSQIGGDYTGLLKRALALDSFTSRTALLRAVKWEMQMSKWRHKVMLPARLAKKYVKYFIQG